MQYQSASRIKTMQSCSWLYYANYVLKLPDKGNDGSKMGSICHDLYECLGNERHRKHYFDVISSETINGSKVVKRFVETSARKAGVNDDHHLELLDRMIVEGLKYDFFGNKYGEPHESHSEINFDITVEEDGKSYRIMGFIDKLFLFKDKGIALIRDFKSSKKKFEGKEVYDNIQDLFYRLAISKLYPEYKDRVMEFVFLQFDCSNGGVIETPHASDDELEGFEHYLTDIQQIMDNFDERAARSNFAYDKGYPAQEDGFSGRLICGRSDHPEELKKDGTKKWACNHKFSRLYYECSKKGSVIKCFDSESDAKEFAKENGAEVKKRLYKGCDKFKFLEYNQEFNQKYKDI